MDATMRIVRATLAVTVLGAGPLAQASVVPLGCYIQFSQPASFAADAVAPGCLARNAVWIGSHLHAAGGSAWKTISFATSVRGHAAQERPAPSEAPDESSALGAADGSSAYQAPIVDFGGGRDALPWQSLTSLSAGGLAWVVPAQDGKLTGSADPRRAHPVANPSVGHSVGGTPVPVAAGGGGTASGGGGTTDVRVPEPGTIALFGLALMLFALKRLLPWWYRGAGRWREKELLLGARRLTSIAV